MRLRALDVGIRLRFGPLGAGGGIYLGAGGGLGELGGACRGCGRLVGCLRRALLWAVVRGVGVSFEGGGGVLVFGRLGGEGELAGVMV